MATFYAGICGKGTAGYDRVQSELLWFYWVTLAYHNPDLSPSRFMFGIYMYILNACICCHVMKVNVRQI